MDEKFDAAMQEFITNRINDLGMDAPDQVGEAIAEVSVCSEKIEAALGEEYKKLWHDMDYALALQVGAQTRYYYKAGFYDAVRFLLGWGDRL